MPKTHDFDLLQNARESLTHAVDHLTRKSPATPQDLKRSILDVTHVVELILKERLQNIHPSFVWEKIDDYPAEDKNTVNTDLAIRRLEKLGGLHFDDETKEAINAARKIRNRIEHFKFSIDEKKTHVFIGRLLSMIFEFTKKQLDLDWEAEFKENNQWKELIKHVEFWNTHKTSIEKRMVEDAKQICSCPFCGAKTFDLINETCELCGEQDDVIKCDECGNLFPSTIMGIGEDVAFCDSCIYYLTNSPD